MAKFCGKCGAQLNENAMFCGKCGSKVEVAEFAYQKSTLTTYTVSSKADKPHWILSFLGQLVCAVLFFLPTINLEALWVVEDVSVMEQVSEAGYSAIYVILLILFFAAALVMLLPVLQSKPLRSNSLVFMQIMSVLFFVVNVIVYIVIGNKVDEQGFGIVEYGLNAWGWIYIIVSVIMIVDLMILSSKTKNN